MVVGIVPLQLGVSELEHHANSRKCAVLNRSQNIWLGCCSFCMRHRLSQQPSLPAPHFESNPCYVLKIAISTSMANQRQIGTLTTRAARQLTAKLSLC